MTDDEEILVIEEFLKALEDNAEELEEKANMAAYLVKGKYKVDEGSYE